MTFHFIKLFNLKLIQPFVCHFTLTLLSFFFILVLIRIKNLRIHNVYLVYLNFISQDINLLLCFLLFLTNIFDQFIDWPLIRLFQYSLKFAFCLWLRWLGLMTWIFKSLIFLSWTISNNLVSTLDAIYLEK